MVHLTEEEFNKELVTLEVNLEKAGVKSISEDVVKKIMNGTNSLNEDSGSSYPGSLVKHMNLVCAIATKIAKMVSGTFTISEESLCKVCMSQHLSKIEMFIENDNQWEVEKRGMNYKFAELPGRLKFGERSIMMAQDLLGLKFDAIEWEAMECIDKDGEEKGGKFYDSILTTVVRQANELAVAIEKEKYKQKK